jgi:hypothetical protein
VVLKGWQEKILFIPLFWFILFSWFYAFLLLINVVNLLFFSFLYCFTEIWWSFNLIKNNKLS